MRTCTRHVAGHAHKELADILLCRRVHERWCHGRWRCKWTAESRCALAAWVMRHVQAFLAKPLMLTALLLCTASVPAIWPQEAALLSAGGYRLSRTARRAALGGALPLARLAGMNWAGCKDVQNTCGSEFTQPLVVVSLWLAMSCACLHRSCLCHG